MGVNVDIGSGGLAELVVPDEYEVSVFAEGLASPRFMDVSADGVLFVAERGADRVVALPDRDADGRADETDRGWTRLRSRAFGGIRRPTAACSWPARRASSASAWTAIFGRRIDPSSWRA